MDFFEQQPSSGNSNQASTSGSSRNDQESGANAMPKAQLALFGFLNGVNLNPARVFMAEVVGTFILMFCVAGITASTQLSGGQVGLLEYATTAGLTVVVVIFSIGSISGAHVNPAITIAFATSGCFPWCRVPFYVLAQCIGSILATWVGSCVYNMKMDLMITRPHQGYVSSAFWAELIATFIVVFLAAAITCQAESVGHMSGLLIGIAISLAVLITGPVSGGSLNPIRSIGPAIVYWKFKDSWIYIIAPTIGAVAGVFTYRLLHLQHEPAGPAPSPKNELLSRALGFARN
ncbi:hypothetical protein ACFE04_015221 [Oxalis oulophora]